MRVGDAHIVFQLLMRSMKIALACKGEVLRLGMVAWTGNIWVVGLDDFCFTTDSVVGFEVE